MSVHHCFVSFIGIKLFILLFHADIAVDYLHAYTEIVFEFEKVSVAYFLFVHYPLTTGGALYLSKQSQHNHTDLYCTFICRQTGRLLAAASD